MKYILAILILFVIIVISITLGAQNEQIVKFNFLLAQGEYRLSVLLAVLFGGGLVIGWLICSLFYLRLRLRLINAERKLKRTQRQADEDKKVVNSVSVLPLIAVNSQFPDKE